MPPSRREHEFTSKNKGDIVRVLVFVLVLRTNEDAAINKSFFDKKLIPVCYYYGNIIV